MVSASGKSISAQRDLVRPPDALGHPGTFKALKVSKVPAGTSALVMISHRVSTGKPKNSPSTPRVSQRYS